MKKQENRKQNLVLHRETLRSLNDETLKSIAGACGGMPFTCTCADITG